MSEAGVNVSSGSAEVHRPAAGWQQCSATYRSCNAQRHKDSFGELDFPPFCLPKIQTLVSEKCTNSSIFEPHASHASLRP